MARNVLGIRRGVYSKQMWVFFLFKDELPKFRKNSLSHIEKVTSVEVKYHSISH